MAKKRTRLLRPRVRKEKASLLLPRRVEPQIRPLADQHTNTTAACRPDVAEEYRKARRTTSSWSATGEVGIKLGK